MKKFIYRMTGIFLIIAAILGWGVSVGGVVLAWKVKPAAESALLSSVDLLDRSLVISNDLLGGGRHQPGTGRKKRRPAGSHH